MGTTTKMAIPYPEATGLVKDGWEDMKDIATQVDAKSGLILISTTSFSAVSSQSINSVFSSTFANYLVSVTITGVGTATDSDLSFRLRASGSDTSSNYSRQYQVWNPTAATVATGINNQTEVYWSTGIGTTNPNSYAEMILINPNVASVTTMKSSSHAVNNTPSQRSVFSHYQQTGSTQFDGFTFYLTSGTMTGSVSVYGYNK